MNKITIRIISLILCVCIIGAVFTACDGVSKDNTPAETTPTTPAEQPHIDYVDQLKLDFSANRMRLEVQWGERSHIDGDTSHFTVSKDITTLLINNRQIDKASLYMGTLSHY